MQLNEPFTFSIENLLFKTGLTREKFIRHIKNLVATNDISFTLPFSGKGIEKLKNSIDYDKLSLSMIKMEETKNRQLKKLEQMHEYFIGRQCRRRYLLDYFGENYPHVNCRGCDICLNWSKSNYGGNESYVKKGTHSEVESKQELIKKTKGSRRENKALELAENEKINSYHKQIIYCGLLKYNNKIGIKSFIKLLKGSKDKKMIQKKFNLCPMYGKLEKISIKDLQDFIIREKQMGFVSKTRSKLYPKMIITDKGKEKIREFLVNEIK
jgi:superfamily II DNA helicase RecQ